MYDILPIYIMIMNSLLISKYFSDFLTPKNIKLPKNIVLVSFGASYLLLQYTFRQLFAGLPLHIASFSNFAALAIIMLTLSYLLFKDDLGKLIFVLFSFLAVQEICLFISLSIFNLMGNVNTPILNILLNCGVLTTVDDIHSFANKVMIMRYAVLMLIYAIFGFFALRNIKKCFVYKNIPLTLTELAYLIMPCLSGLSLTFIIRSIVFKPEGDGLVMLFNNVPFADLTIPLAGFILLLSLIASIKLFQKLAELNNEERGKAVLHNQMRQLQEQIRDVDGIYTEIRGMRHDMKSHISSIRLLVAAVMEGNQDVKSELEEYLGKFENTLLKFEFTYQTGNSISDIIIHQKYNEALNSEISFTSDFTYPARLNLDAYDLAVILNNAIENAIEACSSVVQPFRFIHLHSYTKGEMFFIEVENSFMGRISTNRQTELPISSKSDKTAHGMGISNIQRCARKYLGDIDIQILTTRDYNIFRLTVMLQGKT